MSRRPVCETTNRGNARPNQRHHEEETMANPAQSKADDHDDETVREEVERVETDERATGYGGVIPEEPTEYPEPDVKEED
jgi:hypothetical protein